MSDYPRIDNSFSSGNLRDHNLSASAERREAILNGQKAEQDPYAASVIGREADEEASFAMSDRIDRDIAKRRIQDNQRQVEKRVESKDLADLYFGKNPQKPATVLKNLMQELKNLRNPTPGDILKNVAAHYSDVSDQYIALSLVADELEAEGAGRLADIIREAKDQLMEESGAAIRAGLNIIEEAVQASEQGLGELNNLRDFYRDTVLSHEGILASYRALREEYGSGRLRQGLDFILKAAASDMSAEGPSITKSHLKSIVDNFYEVGVINNISRNLADLLARMRKNYGEGISDDAEGLLEKIFELVEALRVEFGVIVKIPEGLGARELSWQIYFLTGLYDQMRLLPIKIYPSADHRSRLLKAAQDALDYVITEEEETDEPESPPSEDNEQPHR